MGKSRARSKGQRRARQRAKQQQQEGAGSAAAETRGTQTRGADVRRAARREKARKETVALVKALQAAETQDRIQALLALAATFEAGPEKAQEQSEVFEVLFNVGALPVFVARLADGDPSVRHLASGIMCNMCGAGGAEVCSRLINVGIHTAALELAKRPIPPGADDTVKQAMQTRIRALDLLAELCATSPAALRALEDLDGSAFLALVVLLQPAQTDDPELASETVEVVARLLNVALESNPALALCAVRNEAACTALTSFCTGAPMQQLQQLQQQQSEAAPQMRLAHARAVLHAVSALMSMASATPETAQKLAPLEVFVRMLEIVKEVMDADGVDPETVSLALEVVTTACAVSADGNDNAAQGSDHDAALRRACADLVAEDQVAQRCAHIIRSSEETLDSPIAQELAPRACGLLDNVVQNASHEKVAALDPQGMWDASLQVLTSTVRAMDEAGEQAATALEDFADMMTGFLWSIARRVTGARDEGNGSVLSWKASPEQLGTLLNALQRRLPPVAQTNVVGILGVLGASGPASLDAEAVTRIGTALLGSITDTSVMVVAQAIDSSIDMFAADELHPLFMQLQGLNVLKSAIPRLRACLGDSAARIDRESVAMIMGNAEDFVEYKQDFIRQQ